MTATVVVVGDTDFQHQVLESQDPVIVDFHADWCAACKRIDPLLKEVEEQLETHVKCVKVDIGVDKNDALPMQYAVSKLPTLLMFCKGQVVEEISNLTSPQTIARQIQRIMRTGSMT